MISASTSSSELEYRRSHESEQPEVQTLQRKNQPANFWVLNQQNSQQDIRYPDNAHAKKSEKKQTQESLILAEIQLSEHILAGIKDEIDVALKAGNQAGIKVLKNSYFQEQERHEDLLAELKQSRQGSPLLESDRKKRAPLKILTARYQANPAARQKTRSLMRKTMGRWNYTRYKNTSLH